MKDKEVVTIHFIYPGKKRRFFILSYRIEYTANSNGSTVIEYADASRQAELVREAESGTINIINEYRYESYVEVSA